MTDTTKHKINGFTAENEVTGVHFDAALKGAYDAMGPSAEAQERMLAALQQAQRAAADEHDAGADTAEQAPKRTGGVLPFVRKRIVPIAASAAVVLVVVAGAFGVMQQNAPMTMTATESSVEQEKGEGPLLGSSATDSPSFADEASDYAGKSAAAPTSNMPAEEGCIEYPDTDDGFVTTSEQPLSTVSSDVDTTSYCRLRKLVNDTSRGLDELAYEDIRTEEVLNYLSYSYPQASGSELFSMSAQVADCPWNSENKLLVLGYNAAQKQTETAGSNLVFLIDVSGSMADEDKLPLLKKSFEKLVGQLGPNDRVSIVTYSGEESVVLTGARGDERARIMAAINSLEAEGSTNGEAGLKMAYSVAADNRIDGGVNRIVMATDGDLNVGISSDEKLEEFITDKRRSGTYLSILGFGMNGYNDSALETLADNGNGNYHFIDCEAEAQRVLVNNLTKNFEPLANDVKVQVEFNPAQVAQYRLIGYEDRTLAAEDYLDDTKDAGDVGARGQFTLAYELVMADGASGGGNVPALKYQQGGGGSAVSSEWATASLRYKPAGEKTSDEQKLVVSADSYTSSPSSDWCSAAAAIEFVEALNSGNNDRFSSVAELLERADLNETQRDFFALVQKTRQRLGS